MFESLSILGSIILFSVLTYAFQMRKRKYKKYATSCNVLYYPKKEEMNIIEPKDYKSSPPKLGNTGSFGLLYDYNENNDNILDDS